jgi:maltoporin
MDRNHRHRIFIHLTAIAAVVASSAASAVTPDFFGYVRTGVGTSDQGGEQVCFHLPGSGGNAWRLGNECGTYGEIGLGADLSKIDGLTFRYNLMLDYWAGTNAGDEQNLTDDANGRRIGLRQNYVDVKGMFDDKETSIWVGKRYYQRHDVHAMDFFYWNNSGPGFGIENVDVGFGKFHGAFIRTTASTGNQVSDPEHAGNSIDLRVSKIKVNPDGELEVGVDFRQADDRDGTPNNEGGSLFTVEHTQNLLGGFNKLTLQQGAGAGATGGSFNFATTDDAELTRLVEHLVIAPSNRFSLMAAFVHEKTTNNAGAEQTWMSVGVRPMYHWSKRFTSALEVSRDAVEYDNGDEGRLTKITLVPFIIRPDTGPWSRPELRFFITSAKWNDDANDAAVAGGALGLVNDAAYANDNSGTTIGMQVEAWW